MTRVDSPGEADRPQRAPEIRRQLALTRKQLVGLPLLAAVPILTLLGVFGERSATASARSASVSVSVRYPARFRYRQVQPLEVSVKNVSGHALDTVRVSLDTAYISRFSSVRIEPAPRIAFIAELTALKPGESRLVSAEVWGERYGRHRGRIVTSTTTDTAALEVSTFVFP